MKKYKIIVRKSAERDISKITQYVIKISKSLKIAESLIIKIRNSVQILQEYPNAYQTLYNYKFKNRKYKRLVVENFSIIYYIIEKEMKVVIIHIYYNRRNFLKS